MAVPAPRFGRVVMGEGQVNGVGDGRNKVFWPLSEGGYEEWCQRSEGDIRSALRSKVLISRVVSELEEVSKGSGGSTVTVEP